MAAVGVVYLVWVPLGLLPFERFMASYTHYSAELPHNLLVAFNGHQSQSELVPFLARLQDTPHTPHIIQHPQQDIATYLEVTQTATHDYLCFLNSYSELQAHAWLDKLYQPLAAPEVGLVGATGSWETRQIVVPLRNLRTWLRYRLHNRRWPPFPNPHIRSNGFMLKRETLLKLTLPAIRTKKEAYEFESGFYSMTRQIQSWNLQALLVDINGKTYPSQEWAHTHTFRSGDQNHLLITDNRTEDYARADAPTRHIMARMAWGDAALPVGK